MLAARTEVPIPALIPGEIKGFRQQGCGKSLTCAQSRISDLEIIKFSLALAITVLLKVIGEFNFGNEVHEISKRSMMPRDEFNEPTPTLWEAHVLRSRIVPMVHAILSFTAFLFFEVRPLPGKSRSVTDYLSVDLCHPRLREILQLDLRSFELNALVRFLQHRNQLRRHGIH
ncbi:hypothetical protein LENED_007443 [Lentinula edodes]|uniref:Uncharacterized protein n=1 Tax=Lentinula edodes TaxID=5353 RepID=A0A1Q3EEJ3_LENED|nr:hypothetical protein LENED_007443 [Lentinula edodes]